MWSRPARAAIAILVGTASACSAAAGITVTEARTPVPPTDRVAAVYLTITNGGAQDDVLTGVTSDVAEAVELHETVISDGTAGMRPVEALDIPAGASLVLEPGGLHIMLIGLERALEEGDDFVVTLEFARSGPVDVTVEVIAAGEGPDGGGHG
ncbi:MAG: copper chaperone PCu(A)C [Acidimicrobiia bacterium]|jgi:periplasmic copper chaperone A